MNPFKGSHAFLLVVLIPLMLPQVLPEPLRWIWLTLAVLWALKRLGLVSIGFSEQSSSDEPLSPSTQEASEQGASAHRGEIVALGSALYQFDETNRPSYYITLRSAGIDDRTLWGVDLKRIALETPLTVGDTVALEFLGRKAVVIDQPIRNDRGQVVGTRKVNTHRNTWDASVLARCMSH
ncbi:hypothetical protein FGL86_11685 [Pistricoccus aurantiacus]|uniref:DUF4131 domain-containing protein n=1 Tax=Pistricoccus aurantiacus TaxID=1883414 RepID=A0A5B8STJ3_9GAMM|nr:hypothetical protein [Pistricoccus aurantiacus]QEA39664.1 hypothetical protein FGL86_11685 [Pistricoccus aurantiacus]